MRSFKDMPAERRERIDKRVQELQKEISMYSLVPLEGELHLTHGTESKVMSEDHLLIISDYMRSGLNTQEALKKMWLS